MAPKYNKGSAIWNGRSPQDLPHPEGRAGAALAPGTEYGEKP
ncbi:MAG TPA: hypothetical protein V6D02_13625 [Candidatus Obscuribacterales bacterium]